VIVPDQRWVLLGLVDSGEVSWSARILASHCSKRSGVQSVDDEQPVELGGGPQGMTSPVAYWHVVDIEAKLAEVTAACATVKEAAHDVGGGRLVATVSDPDGNVLGLLQDR
jgi:predicted enzyme related to lactoylglutathione lyase